MFSRNPYLDGIIASKLEDDIHPLTKEDYDEITSQIDDIEELEDAVLTLESTSASLEKFSQFFSNLQTDSAAATEMGRLAANRILSTIGETVTIEGNEGLVSAIASGIKKTIDFVVEFVLMIADKVQSFFRTTMGKTKQLRRKVDGLRADAKEMSSADKETTYIQAVSYARNIMGNGPMESEDTTKVLETAKMSVEVLKRMSNWKVPQIFEEYVSTMLYYTVKLYGATDVFKRDNEYKLKKAEYKISDDLDKEMDNLSIVPIYGQHIIEARGKTVKTGAKEARIIGELYLRAGISNDLYVKEVELVRYEASLKKEAEPDSIRAMTTKEVFDSVTVLEEFVNLAMERGMEADVLKDQMKWFKAEAEKQLNKANDEAYSSQQRNDNNRALKKITSMARTWMTIRQKILGAMLKPMDDYATIVGASIKAYSK